LAECASGITKCLAATDTPADKASVRRTACDRRQAQKPVLTMISDYRWFGPGKSFPCGGRTREAPQKIRRIPDWFLARGWREAGVERGDQSRADPKRVGDLGTIPKVTHRNLASRVHEP